MGFTVEKYFYKFMFKKTDFLTSPQGGNTEGAAQPDLGFR